MIATLSPTERHERALRAKQDITQGIASTSDRIDTITSYLGEYERRKAEGEAALAELTTSLKKIEPQIIEARARQRLYFGTPDEDQWTNRLNALQREQDNIKAVLDQVQEQQRDLEDEISANYQSLADERADLITHRASLQQERAVVLTEEREATIAMAQADMSQ